MGAGYDGGDGETPWVGVLMKGGSARWVADVVVAGEGSSSRQGGL